MTSNLPRRALLLSYFTVGYNVLEGLISIIAGAWAGSIALVGFGLDSFVESLSGGVMIWRFTRTDGLTPEDEARREQRAVKIVGCTFFVLGAYVLYESLKKLYFREMADPTLLGLIIAGVSLIAMPVLFYLKYRTGRALGSQSLMADSRQTLTCAFLSLALLMGLGMNYWYGVWQADPVIGLVIVGFLFREGYQALKAGKLCTCGSCGV
ncbi:MAG: hypothetical protein FJ126_10295 [Deltaproteobacteria bacterium]|nr:hypothetical protein [Deltaproteobacteria bacterium]